MPYFPWKILIIKKNLRAENVVSSKVKLNWDYVLGLHGLGFGSRATGMASVRRCQKLPSCLTEPVSGRTKDECATGQGRDS